MPRALRLESENASYHVINRGNYKSPLFRSAKTKNAFLQCLEEACDRTRWCVHAWCLMSTHFHLAITTPEANLAPGMHWLQCTFAQRFNRFRNERGHVFQGRYTSVAIENGDALGSVCHYIHLNPVRAHLCSAAELAHYPWTSLPAMISTAARPGWFAPLPALHHAGGLADTAAGHKKYLQYLDWLAEDDPEQKRQRFDRMCRGWAIGTNEFARALMAENRELRVNAGRLVADMKEAYEAQWQSELAILLARLRRTEADLHASGKSAEWKVALAAVLKARTTVTNPWLSRHLYLGNRHEIGRKVAAWWRAPKPALLALLEPKKPTPHNPTP